MAKGENFETLAALILYFSKHYDYFAIPISFADNRTVVTITGSSGVAAVWGLNHYLKYSCRSHVSWETQQLALPHPLPTAQFTLTARDRFR